MIQDIYHLHLMTVHLLERERDTHTRIFLHKAHTWISSEKKANHRILLFSRFHNHHYNSNSETTKNRSTHDDDDDKDSSDAIPTMRFFFGDELFVYVVVLVCFFGKHKSAITTEIVPAAATKAILFCERILRTAAAATKTTKANDVVCRFGRPEANRRFTAQRGHREAVGGAISGFARID